MLRKLQYFIFFFQACDLLGKFMFRFAFFADTMSKVILSLGSNLGNREKFLADAIVKINQRIGEVLIQSSVFQTTPWGFDSSELFLNQIIMIHTELTPQDVLHIIHEIEHEAGRIRSAERFNNRTLDIDIIFYDDLILDTPELQIPHPTLHQRLFVLMPLHEVAPGWIHPILRKDVTSLLQACDDILCHLVKIK